MTEIIKKKDVVFYTDANVAFYVTMPIKADESGEWLTPDQATRLEALNSWARFLIQKDDKVKKTKKLFRHAKSPSWVGQEGAPWAPSFFNRPVLVGTLAG